MDELKPREVRLLGGILEGKSARQSAVEAGYPAPSAASQASRFVNRPDVRERLQRLREQLGLGDEALLLKAKELLESQQYAMTRDGEVKHLGPDNLAQSRTLDQLFRAGGLYPDPRLDVQVGTQNVLVIDSARSPLAALDPFNDPPEQSDE